MGFLLFRLHSRRRSAWSDCKEQNSNYGQFKLRKRNKCDLIKSIMQRVYYKFRIKYAKENVRGIQLTIGLKPNTIFGFKLQPNCNICKISNIDYWCRSLEGSWLRRNLSVKGRSSRPALCFALRTGHLSTQKLHSRTRRQHSSSSASRPSSPQPFSSPSGLRRPRPRASSSPPLSPRPSSQLRSAAPSLWQSRIEKNRWITK